MKNLLLDTNVLLLLIIGSFDRNSVAAYRRTRQFTGCDFDLLQSQLRRFATVRTTASVLTEASNLLGNDFHETVAGTMVNVCTPFVEVVRTKEAVFAQEGFARLGFGDASVMAALDETVVVLTDDVDLYNQVLYAGHEAINFNHLRTWST